MRLFLPVTALLAITELLAQPAGAPGNVRSWDLVTYTVPHGFKLSEEKAGAGARARAVLSNAGTSGCLIAIHTSSPAGNSLTASFTAEWQAIGPNSSPAPQPAVRAAGNTRAAVGKLASDSGEQLMLLVLDAGTRVISVLVVSSTKEVFDVCIPHLAALLSSMEVASVRRPSNSSAAPVFSRPRIVDGKLVIPPLSRVLTAADLSGEWGQNSSFTTRYVDRASGVYAGYDSLHFTEKWLITKEGRISMDFFAIQNGRRISEETLGTVTVAGRLLTIRKQNTQRYVIRGWLELPDVTIMKLNGSYYNEPIPANVFTDPDAAWNLDNTWVRKR